MARRWRPKKDVVCQQCGWQGRRVSTAKSCPQCHHWHPIEQVVEEGQPKYFIGTIATESRHFMFFVRAMKAPWNTVTAPAIKRFARELNGGKAVAWSRISIFGHDGGGTGPNGEYTRADWNRDLQNDNIKKSFGFVTIDAAGIYRVDSYAIVGAAETTTGV